MNGTPSKFSFSEAAPGEMPIPTATARHALRQAVAWQLDCGEKARRFRATTSHSCGAIQPYVFYLEAIDTVASARESAEAGQH